MALREIFCQAIPIAHVVIVDAFAAWTSEIGWQVAWVLARNAVEQSNHLHGTLCSVHGNVAVEPLHVCVCVCGLFHARAVDELV